jgi:purine-cytosine permease-like protein
MTDVSPDSGAPGAPPVQPWDPSGIRRSNFTPAPADAEPPTFDDDALADAMAAEVSPYTSEIKLPHLLPPEGAEFSGPSLEDVLEPVADSAPAASAQPTVEPVPVAPIPLVEPARFLDSGFPADTAPLSAATGLVPAPASTSPEEEELRRALGGASTLEAMERLEDEFRRVSSGEPPSIVLPATTGETPATPAEPASASDSVRRVNTDVFSWLSATTVSSAPAEAPEPQPAGSVFDIPDAAAPVPERTSEPTVDPLDALAFGGSWAHADAVEGPATAAPGVEAAAESAGIDTRTTPLGPLPGTDALGWNTPASPLTPPPPLTPAERELAEPEAVEPEFTADSPPAATLAEPLGTEVWSLFPDEDVDELAPSPQDGASELSTTAAAPAVTAAEPEQGSTFSGTADAVPNVESSTVEPAPHPEPAAFAWMFPASTADVAPIDEPSFPFPDPVADDPGGAPVAFESLATAAVPIVSPQLASDPAPLATVEPDPKPDLQPQPESSGFAGLPPVDESLIDPEAAAAAAAAVALAATIPPPLSTPAPAEPWAIAGAGDDGVWDLGAETPVSESSSESASDPEVGPEPGPDLPPLASNPAIAAAAAAAAMAAATPLLPAVGAPIPPSPPGPPPVELPAAHEFSAASATTESEAIALRESVPAPPPTVLSTDAGPQSAVAVPYSLDPPVGPESPDWLDAPPPVYTPPELVEPPPTDTPMNPALDPIAPITANTMARLPVPLPSEVPNIADRAELPPPPGYEDIPIMSSDAAAQSASFAPILFAPAMSAPFVPTVALEPLLPVPPSAPAIVENSVPVAAEGPAALESAAPEPESAAVVTGAPALAVISDDDLPQATESASLDDDAIDEVDRVGASAMVPLAAAGTVAGAAVVTAAEPAAPFSEPISTVRLDDDQAAIVDEKPKVSALDVESAGVEPTALDLRTGRAARLFWLWFAANSSVVSLGLGAVLLGTGMSLRQSIVATLAGVAISFLPLGLGTLAGKWSGQPTMVVSRAAFGHAGNILPAVLAVVTRVFWGGVLLWLLATAVAQILVGAGLDAGLGTGIWELVGLAVGFVIATVVAVFGYGFVARLQLVLSIVNALLILGAAALTFQHLDFATALTVPDGSWVLAVGGAAIVFSVIGLAWVHSSSDIARYQRPGASGGASMLWATFGATLPPFLLICWGAILAASDPTLASKLQTNPLGAIAGLLPAWYPVPLLAAAALGLLSGAVLTIYSGGFAVLALGLKLRRSVTTLLSAVLVLAAAAVLLFVVSDFASIARGLIIAIAVPVAAWAGIFAAEMMIRTRRFHTPSLLAPGGIYPQVRWLNLIGLVVISAVSYGFVTSDVAGLQWQGFLFSALGVGPADPWAVSNIGVFVSLLLGILLPLASGIPAIRRQEATVTAGHAATPVAAPAVTTAPVVTAAPGPFTTPASTPASPRSDALLD